MRLRIPVLGLLLVGLLCAGAGAGAAQQQPPNAIGSPDLNVYAPNPTVQPGQVNEVTVQVANDGDLRAGTAATREIVTTARSVTVEFETDDSPITVKTGETSVGAVPETRNAEIPVAVEVPESVDAGSYTVDVSISYSYTSRQTSRTTFERSTTETTEFDVQVDDGARFEIHETTTDTRIGDTGMLETRIENVGSETASNVGVVLESSASSLLFGEAAAGEASVDELEPGENATLIYDLTVTPDASERRYPIDATVRFETPQGFERADTGLSTAVRPAPEQEFAIEAAEPELYVGEQGDIHGVVTNEGPTTAQNVVVRYTDQSPNVVPIERSVAVGTLEAGESAEFGLPVEIVGEADPVSRVVDLGVQYRTTDFEKRLYEEVEIVTDVQPARDQFTLEVDERTLTAGQTTAIDVQVTNNLDETVTDVEARLFADDPLSTDDEGYVEALGPGESATMSFEVSAAGGATPKTYPISFDFRYDDEAGTSQVSDTTRVAVDITPAEGGLPGLSVGLFVSSLVGGLGTYLYRRR